MARPSRTRERAGFESTLTATILVVCALLAACTGGGSTPTEPSPSPPPPPGAGSALTLNISAELEARSPLVLIGGAALLYDASTISTRLNCLDSVWLFGCRRGRFAVTIQTSRGAHAVALQLRSHTFDLSPSNGTASYDVEGTVIVSDVVGIVQEIALVPRTASLAPGDSVVYSIDVLP